MRSVFEVFIINKLNMDMEFTLPDKGCGMAYYKRIIWLYLEHLVGECAIENWPRCTLSIPGNDNILTVQTSNGPS
jgi:hypothetical protein